MIDGYIITIKNNKVSEAAFNNACKTIPSNMNAQKFNAVTPAKVDDMMKDMEWTYPWKGQRIDIKSGLTLNAYQTQDPKARIACFLSHWVLWHKCVYDAQPLVIMEHDVVFFKGSTLPLQEFKASPYDIIGLNSPLGATRRANIYHSELQKGPSIGRAPAIDSPNIPQGLAGNSCYYIEPSGALKMIELVDEYGCWPNDALMCRQLVPTLGATKIYYSQVQGTASTTT